jgi:NADPH-dependent 2,4-dienoyl-CoA reductase/sulfur reductase-like enzyme
MLITVFRNCLSEIKALAAKLVDVLSDRQKESMNPTIKTEIVIVGAGPTGLSLGCQLLRYGIDFVVVEKNERITPYSKLSACMPERWKSSIRSIH